MRLARAIETGAVNKVFVEDAAAHDWYRFVLSFPPHLVRSYLERFELTEKSCLLDPFCGTGTTLVESKKLGIPSIGIEANPMAHFASKVKLDWSPDPEQLLEHSDRISASTLRTLTEQGLANKQSLWSLQPEEIEYRQLPEESTKLFLRGSISKVPLHKTLVLLEELRANYNKHYSRHELLALAKALITSIGNLHFGPEVGIGPAKADAPVVESWLAAVHAMANDLRELAHLNGASAHVYRADARQTAQLVRANSIDAVITSPPYPNEKDYTRTTRLESVLLGFITNKAELQALKRSLVRSNTRNVYKGDTDDRWIQGDKEIIDLAARIEERRLALGKTSGFERLYAKVTLLYFGGIKRHLSDLTKILRPGAHLAYVVGDQASYLRIMIRTGNLLARIAESLGYRVDSIDLFRSRLSSVTKEQLREEVVVLCWPGRKTLLALRGKNEQMTSSSKPSNRYSRLIENIFFSHYSKGAKEVCFERKEFEIRARELKINLPKNIGDIVYSFRYRTLLPDSIRAEAEKGKHWIIRSAGPAKYCFVLAPEVHITPSAALSETKIPDSTPGLVSLYRVSETQALLSQLRYNRLIDIFSGITCYSLQSQLKTTVAGVGQVETDEIYIGVDRKGVHYVFPIQVKAGLEKLSVIEVEQDIAVCASKFPGLICRPLSAQLMDQDLIALFEMEATLDGVKVVSEKHYRLVSPSEVTPEILESYRERLPGN